MTRLPTVVAVRHLTDSLRVLEKPLKNGRLMPRIDMYEARTVRAVDRDRSGAAIRDGYPARTLTGGNRGGPSVVVEDEDGQPDVVPVTAVEGAVIARGDRPIRDRHHELTVKAVHALEDAVTAVQVWVAALASIEDLIKTTGPAPKTCDHCTSKRGKGGDRRVHVRGTVGDRLEAALALCEACYSFVVQTAPAGSRTGYLPSDEQITHHEHRNRWKIRVTGQARQ